jgi:hypothetical protein
LERFTFKYQRTCRLCLASSLWLVNDLISCSFDECISSSLAAAT